MNREEVYVERHPVDTPVPAETPLDQGEEVIRVPVSEEQVQVTKRIIQEMRTIRETVQKEQAAIEAVGDFKIREKGEGDTTDT